MANTNPKKPALHNAAASSHSKAEAVMDQAKPTNTTPNDPGRMPRNAGTKSGSDKKSH